MNQPGRRRVLFDFLPQTQNVHIHSTIGNSAVLPPDGVQQLLATEDNAWPAHQEFQKTEFGGGQGKVLPGQFHLATAAVQFHAAGFEEAGWRRLRPELKLDAGDQFADEERFNNIIVRAKLEPDAVGFGSAAPVKKSVSV